MEVPGALSVGLAQREGEERALGEQMGSEKGQPGEDTCTTLEHSEKSARETELRTKKAFRKHGGSGSLYTSSDNNADIKQRGLQSQCITESTKLRLWKCVWVAFGIIVIFRKLAKIIHNVHVGQHQPRSCKTPYFPSSICRTLVQYGINPKSVNAGTLAPCNNILAPSQAHVKPTQKVAA